jgi:sec-independent protein translocase protein TatA
VTLIDAPKPVLLIGGLGMPEMLTNLVIVILLFGASRLPKLARSMGQGITEFKKGLKERPEDDDEPKPPTTTSGEGKS